MALLLLAPLIALAIFFIIDGKKTTRVSDVRNFEKWLQRESVVFSCDEAKKIAAKGFKPGV